MNNLFENRLVVDDSRIDLIPLIIEELKAIPLRLLRFVFEKGMKIYVPVPGDKLFFTRNQLEGLGEFSDGREYSETSHFSENESAIIIMGRKSKFIKNGYPISVAVHEFAHAVGYILGEDLPKGEPLDSYAGRNMSEKFAVAFETFFLPELFYNDVYIVHSKLELFRKSPEIFRYFEQFFRNW